MPGTSDASSSIGGDDAVQGEGDYDAARRYDKAAREFAESGRVEPAAHDAAPADEAEAEALRRAEEIGRSHAKGEDRPPADGPGSTPSPGGVNARR